MAEDFQMGNGNWWESSRNDFHGEITPAASDQSSNGRALANQMLGLGLSSETTDWNQALLPGEKATSDFHQDFSFDQSHFMSRAGPNNNSTITGSQNLSTGFMSLLMSEKFQQPNENQPMLNNYTYPITSTTTGYGVADSSQLQSTNINTPLWSGPTNEPPAVRPGGQSCFFPTEQFGSSLMRKDQNVSNKRSRSETPSALPAFKVRKEKMGDRITALQQLVSPFGKTDTASVLSETIEYIKFLHEQIGALSSPYTKSGAPIHHQQSSSKNKLDPEGPREDLRSRGLCLVPISSTLPVTHDQTTVDFWAPTFGGSFR
ncbi:basic helix-loop-helix (bHLH) DNA-bindingsuperfamily protein [Striga asiatica]|uniref:Basic helix-loop-helix (BHLH) DNA-bindingsuperfamily protein n=1 Tax=Striga asiatica TaxID=4170 RepID=A0A5A7R7V5_STRAF|nr:basic helix-loop-helix (bHLH) DNA-bindingsuperfamily protein [Striga asiatica]